MGSLEEALSEAMAVDLSTLPGRQKAEPLYDSIISSNSQSATVNDSDRKQLALAYNNRGQIKYMRVDFNEAVEDYSLAIQLDESLAVAFYNRGQIHYRLARYQQAVDDFEACLKLQPDFKDCKLNLRQAEADIELQRQGLNSSFS